MGFLGVMRFFVRFCLFFFFFKGKRKRIKGWHEDIFFSSLKTKFKTKYSRLVFTFLWIKPLVSIVVFAALLHGLQPPCPRPPCPQQFASCELADIIQGKRWPRKIGFKTLLLACKLPVCNYVWSMRLLLRMWKVSSVTWTEKVTSMVILGTIWYVS